MTVHLPAVGGTSVAPDFSAVTGSGFDHMVGALLTITLITAVAALLVAAITWAVAASAGSWMTVAKARIGLLVAAGGAVLAGGGLAWTNWLLDTGRGL